MMGVVRLQQGRSAEALAILEPLLTEAPDNADIRTQCGLARQELAAAAKRWRISTGIGFATRQPANLLLSRQFPVESGQYAQALDSYERLAAYRTRL